MAPGLKFVHPGGTGLNDLQLLEVLVPVPVGSSDNVLGLLVGRFDVSQRNLPVAIGQDAVEMVLHHGGKALEWCQTAPFQGIDPLPEELGRPGPGLEIPEVVEGLLEKMRLEEPGADEKKLRKGFPGLALQV